VNCKTYKQGTGANALKLAKICEHVALEMDVTIAIAVQALDVAQVASAVSIPVFAQHVDGVDLGAHTGAIAPEALSFAGAAGSLINHSEWRIPLRNIAAAVKQCHKYDLDVVACADTPENAREVASAKPNFIAIEPPELIGGTISVSAARPEVITQTTKGVRVPVLCGAGIHTREDVRKAVDLGTVGVLVASGVVLAKDPEKVLKELVLGLRPI
jgi:triosephosphate isomerase